MDLLTTSLRLSGAFVPGDRVIDGVDMAPILFEGKPSRRSTFCYYRGTQLYAMRKGVYKAHFITCPGYTAEPATPHDPPLLFDLNEDPGESFDAAAQHPDVVADILQEVERHRASVVPGKCQLEVVVTAQPR